MNTINKQLAKLVINMARVDITTQKKANRRCVWDQKMFKRMNQNHTKRMKAIIKKYGWPTVSLVGKEASHMAWLLVQHADHDVRFQKKCLQLLKEVFQKNQQDIQKNEIAFLTDRILVNDGKKQLFGTQWRYDKRGIFRPRPIDKIKLIEKRRREYGLGSFKEFYKEALASPAPRPKNV